LFQRVLIVLCLFELKTITTMLKIQIPTIYKSGIPSIEPVDDSFDALVDVEFVPDDVEFVEVVEVVDVVVFVAEYSTLKQFDTGE
jgi:hypothetical protein